MDRDELAVRLEESLGKAEPHPLDHEVIVARAGRRRRRRQVGTIGVGLGLVAIAAVAIAIAGGPSEGPLGAPMVEASARVTLPGEVVGAHGQILDTAATEGDHLWVLTCSRRCGGPPARFEHSRGTLVEIDSRSGAIVARTPVEGASIVAAGEGGIWTAGFDGTVTHFDPGTDKPLGSLHLSLPKPVGDNHPEAFDFLPNHIVVGEGSVWVSTEREYVAQIDPETTRVMRMIPTHFGVSGLAAGGGRRLGLALGRPLRPHADRPEDRRAFTHASDRSPRRAPAEHGLPGDRRRLALGARRLGDAARTPASDPRRPHPRLRGKPWKGDRTGPRRHAIGRREAGRELRRIHLGSRGERRTPLALGERLPCRFAGHLRARTRCRSGEAGGTPGEAGHDHRCGRLLPLGGEVGEDAGTLRHPGEIARGRAHPPPPRLDE
jgi:hypothetical protein